MLSLLTGIKMNTKSDTETSFIVFPEHTNHMSPIIFGGKFMAEMDLCAAKCARRALYESKVANGSVTHKANFTFLKPAYLGDLIVINSYVSEVREKSLTITTNANRETKDGFEKIAEATFVFVAIAMTDGVLATKPMYLPYINHGLETISG
jgi:acyl-CoA hydrolase